MNEPKTQLVSGNPVTEDHREIDPKTGMQKDYVVLTAEERAKGFVRPVRHRYVHVGERPVHPLRYLTEEELDRYVDYGYAMFEEYPDDGGSLLGRFWTKDQLNSGCGAVTTMAQEIAETYAQDPKFYGDTFCIGCRKHLPLSEFVWDGTDLQVGS